MTGCSGTQSNSDTRIPAQFKSDFNADYGNLRLSGHISRLETGIYTITLTSPETISGISISYVGGMIATSLEEIGFEAESENLPTSGFIGAVAQTIDSISKSPLVEITRDGGHNRYCTADNAIILQDADTGALVSLSIKSADISMNFIDFEVK